MKLFSYFSFIKLNEIKIIVRNETEVKKTKN